MGFNVVVIGLESVSSENGVFTIQADGSTDGTPSQPDPARFFDARLTFSVEVVSG